MVPGPDNPQPRYVTWPCQNCSGHIEFDASEFEKGETRTVECPHCHLDTIIFASVQSTFSTPAQAASVKHPKPIAASPNPKQPALFFYKTGETEKGPYTFEQLRSLWNNAQITGDTLFRDEHSAEWKLLSLHVDQQRAFQFKKLNNWLLKCFFVISLAAFFLPNASISVPIFGTIEVSMFDFFTPKPATPKDGSQKPQKPNFKDVIDSDSFQIKKASMGADICFVAGLGILLHYLLTIVWGVLRFGFKRRLSMLNIAWLSLA